MLTNAIQNRQPTYTFCAQIPSTSGRIDEVKRLIS
jgi:hypothetical protein